MLRDIFVCGGGEFLEFSKIALVEKSAEEIELENQNEILKMQIENKKLQKELGALEKVKSARDAQKGGKDNQNQTKTPKVRDEIAKSKSGFSLGIEGELSAVRYERNLLYCAFGTSLDSPQYPCVRMDFDTRDTKLLFLVGLNAGYQHYFIANHGLRVYSSLSSGTPYSDTKKASATEPGVPTNQLSLDFKTEIIPLKIGLGLDYLWDFFNRGKHSLGLNLGIGYEFNVWFINNVASNSARTLELPASTIISHNFYPKIGLHYYYGNHQFSLDYKFGGLFGGMMGHSIRTNPIDSAGVDPDMMEFVGGMPALLSFGYSYRF